MSQDLPQYELWQQCRDWLINVGALERNIECNHLRELGAALKDGVRLCKLANILKDGCIEKSSIYVIISDSSVSFDTIIKCSVNIPCTEIRDLLGSDIILCDIFMAYH